MFLEYYYNTIIKYDLINKFYYKSINEIPKLKKIILNFECKNFTKKTFAITLLSLKLISTKSGLITKANKPHIFLKIQKGQPIGCKVILVNNNMYQFLEQLLIYIIPNIKFSLKLKKTCLSNKNSFSFTITNKNIIFPEIKEHFNLISKLSKLHITFVTNTKTKNELFFLLKSFKLPINN